jgi:hypothetical protein
LTALVTEIVGLLVASLTSYAQGIGEGLSAMVTSIFLTGTGETQTLSAFGAIICIFAGLSLAIGLSRWVTGFVTSLGARN